MDNETGGLDDKTSLLSTYLEVVDEQFNVIDSLEMFIKPNDGLYVVEAGGLDVNKINIVEHDKIAITAGDAGQKLFRFLQKHSNDGKIKLIPVGKNVQFDVSGLQRHLLSKKNMDKFVSYRLIDITGIAMGLQIKGKLPPDLGLSLFSLAQYFSITAEGNAHEAKYDTKVTMLVWRALLNLL
jgi:DNA polymerase III alpha subunit (gram-positive type)